MGSGLRKTHGQINGMVPAPLDLMPTESVGFVILRISGVSAAAHTVIHTDVPDIHITLQHRKNWPSLDLARINLDWLIDINDAFFGRPTANDAAGNGLSFDYQVIFPLMLPGELNALDIHHPGDLQVRFAAAGAAADFASLVLEVGTISIKAVESYLAPYILQSFTLPGVGATNIERISTPNLRFVMLDDASVTDPTHLSLDLVNPRNRLVDHLPWDMLRDLTSLSQRVEAAALDKTIVEVSFAHDTLSSIAESGELTFFGGAGTLNILTVNTLYSDPATRESKGRWMLRDQKKSLAATVANQAVPIAVKKAVASHAVTLPGATAARAPANVT